MDLQFRAESIQSLILHAMGRLSAKVRSLVFVKTQRVGRWTDLDFVPRSNGKRDLDCVGRHAVGDLYKTIEATVAERRSLC